MYHHLLFRLEGSGLFLATKPVPEERTARILEEIERAEKIFRRMCDGGELDEEMDRARNAGKEAAAIRRILR